jgi:hypothetical protein
MDAGIVLNYLPTMKYHTYGTSGAYGSRATVNA